MRKSLSITFASKFLSALLNLFIITMLSQQLGAEGKGLCTMLITIISVGQVLCDIIGGSALTYLAPKVNFKKLLMQSYLWIFLICFIIQGFTLFQFGKNSEFFFHIFALNFLNAAIGTHQNILIGLQKYKTSSILGFLQVLFLASFLIFFLTFNKSITAYIFALYISWALIFLAGLILILLHKLPQVEQMSGHNVLSAFKFGFINQFAHILQFVNLRLSYFLLPAFALGIYSNANSISESLWLISSSFSAIIYGSISNSNQSEKNILITIRSIKAVFIATICGGILMALLPTSFYGWLFGKDFLETNQIILYLLPGMLFFGIYLIPGHYFSGSGHFMKNIWCIACGLSVTIVSVTIIYFTNTKYTPQLAAIVTSASYLANMIVALRIFMRDTNTPIQTLIPSKEDFIWVKSILVKH